MLRSAVALCLSLCASPALAQSAYVVGAIGADITRSASSETNGTTYAPGDGETMNGAIRAGVFVADRWGIELEYNRGGEMETGLGGIVYPLARVSTVIGMSNVPPVDLSLIRPDVTVSRRHTTLSTLAFVRQTLSD